MKLFKYLKDWYNKLLGRRTISGEAYLMVDGEEVGLNNFTFDIEENEDFDPSEIEGLKEGEFELTGFRWGNDEIDKIGFKPEERGSDEDS